jgi:hypothetical protein
MNQQTLKKLKKGLGLWVIILINILLPIISFAQDEIIVPLPDAKKMVVNLEKSNLYEKQVLLLEKANVQLTEQNIILQEQTKILKEQIQLKQEQIDLTVKEIENQKQIYEEKIEIYEKEKPSLFDKALLIGGGLGLGLLIGLLL